MTIQHCIKLFSFIDFIPIYYTYTFTYVHVHTNTSRVLFVFFGFFEGLVSSRRRSVKVKSGTIIDFDTLLFTNISRSFCIRQGVELGHHTRGTHKLLSYFLVNNMSNTWRDLLLNDDAYWLSLLVASLQITWAGFSVIFALFARFGLKSQGEGSSRFLKYITPIFQDSFCREDVLSHFL